METIDYDKKGRIFNIQRYSIHDGPGIRTIVFLKGCYLRCKWCFNPESQDPRITKLFGKVATVREVYNEIKKDQAVYRRSGGGITFSGGEALLQPDFVEELIKVCHLNGWTTAVETEAYVPEETIRRIIPQLDYVYMDIKAVPSNVHKSGTGVNNQLILSNAPIVAKLAKHLTIRTPVIPTFNFSKKQINYICKFILKKLKNIHTLHLLPYQTFGVKKYRILHRKYQLKGINHLTNKDLLPLKKVVEKAGLHCQLGE